MTIQDILTELGLTNNKLAKRLADYNDEVLDMNEHLNLTGIRDRKDSLVKNIYDSLTVYEKECFPVGGTLLDLGTGGGFPGVVLALLRPDMRVTLMDAIRKKLAFIERTADKMEISNIRCLHMRAEEGGRRKKIRETFDIVTARAVKSLPVVTEWALPFVKVGGFFAAMKGPGAEEELKKSGRVLQELNGEWSKTKTLRLPTGEQRTILYFRKTAPCPKIYPRKNGMAERYPLLGEK